MRNEMISKEYEYYPIWLGEQLGDIKKNELLESVGITSTSDGHHDKLTQICIPILLFTNVHDFALLSERAIKKDGYRKLSTFC